MDPSDAGVPPPDDAPDLAHDEPTLQIPIQVQLPLEDAHQDATTLSPSTRADLDQEVPERGRPQRHAGRYLVEGEIGRGGMGVVYQAFDRDLRRRVAMKVLPMELGRGAIERFVEEAQSTAQLQHPGIVPVHEIGRDGEGRLFFTMKLVQGRNLAQIVEALRAGDPDVCGRFSRFRLLQAFVEVARTVDYAHARGVVHRDLKPQNIMLGRYGEVQVLDWGLVKVRGESDRLPPIEPSEERQATRADSVMGTPAYMPPEQARGESTPRSDIYSLGATLYHLLTGRAPYQGPPLEILEQVGAGPPPAPRSLDRRIPAELQAICLRAMACAPEDRYASAGALAEDVQAHLEGRAVAANPQGLFGRSVKAIRRRPTLAATVALSLVLGVIGLAVAVVMVSRQRSAAVAQGERAEEQQLRAEENATLARDLRSQAEANEALAREQSEQAREAFLRGEELVGAMLFGLFDELAPLGRTDLLETVAEAALEHYQALPSRHGEVSAVLHRRAKLHNRIAQVLNHQGRLTRAVEAHQQALELCRELLQRDPDRTEWILQWAETLHAIAVIRRGQGRLQAALGLLRQAARAEERAPRAMRAQLPRILNQMGIVHRLLGQYEEAVEIHGRAAEQLRTLEAIDEAGDQPSGEEGGWRQLLATVLNDRAAALQLMGAQRRALEDLAAASDHLEDLLEEEPDHARWLSKLARVRHNQGGAHDALGESAEAARAYLKAIEIRQRLREQDPQNLQRAWEVANSRMSLGIAERSQGRSAEALAAYREAIATFEELVEADPTNLAWRRAASMCHNNMASVLLDLGRRAESLAHLQQAVALRPEEEGERPQTLHDLGDMHHQIGLLQQLLGNDAGAIEPYRKAIGYRERLLALAPDETGRRWSLARTCYNLGTARANEQQLDDALEAYRQAASHQERALEGNRDKVSWILELAKSHHMIAKTLRRLGKPGEARFACERALQLREQLVQRDPENADWEAALLLSLLQRGGLRLAEGDLETATAALQRCRERGAALVERSPTSAQAVYRVAHQLASLAVDLWRQSHLAEARLVATEAVLLTAAVQQQYPSHAQLKRALALRYFEAGCLEAHQGHDEAARDCFGQAERLGIEEGALWVHAFGGESPGLEAQRSEADWMGALARHALGEATSAELLALAAEAETEAERFSREAVAHTYIGLQAEAAGDLATARAQYRLVAESGATDSLEAIWAVQRLAQLSQ